MQPAISAPMNAHDFTFDNIDGGALPLSQYAGQPILLVNTASLCGFTRQYAALQEVWTQFRDRGLVVLGVPSEDFGGQEYVFPENSLSEWKSNWAIPVSG